MKKTLVALAAAAAISPAAFAGDISFKGDANVEGFFANSETNSVDQGTNAGYSSRIRLAGSAKTDGNISVNFRLLLNNSVWQGDTHAGVTGAYEQTGSDPVAVDYGYIQMPIAGWTVRAGRQVANWAGCFITCNENRDRLLAMKRFGGTTVIAINDKRMEGGEATSNSDRDMYAGAAIGMHKGWLWGMLVSTWRGADKDILEDVIALMPYVKGKAGGVELEASINLLTGGDGELDLSAVTTAMQAINPAYPTDIYGTRAEKSFNDSHLSGFLRAGYDFGSVKLEGLGLFAMNGGLLDPGFDTYSMGLNSNPKTDASNTNVFNFGRDFGRTEDGRDYDEYLISVKLSGKASEQLTLSAAAGIGNTEESCDDDATNTLCVAGETYEVDYTFINAQASYQIAKTTEAYAGIELLTVDPTGDDNETDHTLAKVGVSTSF